MIELKTKERIRKIIFTLAISLSVLSFLRLVLKVLGASPNNGIINFFYQLTYPIVQPFTGIIPDIISGSSVIEPASFIAVMMWLAFAVLLSTIVETFMHDSVEEIIADMINLVFKIVEFLLAARVVLRMLNVPTTVTNPIISVVYGLGNIVYAPFAGIAPGISLGEYRGVLEISTLIALIIVFIIDFISDGFIRSLLGVETKKRPARVVHTNPTNVNVIVNAGDPDAGAHKSRKRK